MRILISSLQVSQSGSKGHLHPAVEIALEAKRQGHTVAILPMPSRLGDDDKMQLQKADIEYIEAPYVPPGFIKTPEELALLASDKGRVHLAYSSFLLDPIPYQAVNIERILTEYKPDVVLYDLLVYTVPLVARSLGIPDFGYCAGLKLLAPESLLETYAEVATKLSEKRTLFLKISSKNFIFIILNYYQGMGRLFSQRLLLWQTQFKKPEVRLVGPLPSSSERGDLKNEFSSPEGKFAVLSFGSVLDPYDFPENYGLNHLCYECVRHEADNGIKEVFKKNGLPKHVKVFPYLPIPSLIQSAEVYIHHGGANSFSEGLRLGARQVLIPLTTDQPIQAHYLRQSGAGITIAPSQVNDGSMRRALETFGILEHPIHANITRMKKEYASEAGAANFLAFVTNFLKGRI